MSLTRHFQLIYWNQKYYATVSAVLRCSRNHSYNISIIIIYTLKESNFKRQPTRPANPISIYNTNCRWFRNRVFIGLIYIYTCSASLPLCSIAKHNAGDVNLLIISFFRTDFLIFFYCYDYVRTSGHSLKRTYYIIIYPPAAAQPYLYIIYAAVNPVQPSAYKRR